MLLFKYSIMLQTKSLENIVSPTHLVVYHILHKSHFCLSLQKI